MKSGNFVDTNTYFSSFYIFTALHGIHLLGGLFFWGKVCSKTLKLKAIALNRAKHTTFFIFRFSDNLKRKYKEIQKKDKNKTSLYKKLSPNILGEVINNIVPEKARKKLLNLSIRIL